MDRIDPLLSSKGAEARGSTRRATEAGETEWHPRETTCGEGLRVHSDSVA